jgi:probable rRNA maturation factor
MSSDGSSYLVFAPASRAALSRRVTQRHLHEFFATLCRRLARGTSFGCLITGDPELRRLNRQFRGKNQPTDVLSFPSGTPDALGEIAISADRAWAQARAYGHSLGDELGILMLHGLLHLKGYDHETDAGEMARVERRWRKALGLPCGLIERVRP